MKEQSVFSCCCMYSAS